jgi:hypothetical protein
MKHKMKHHVRLTLITVALVLTALVPAQAQNTSATVNVPFPFTVDGVHMPAGEYRVTSPFEKVITIQRVSGKENKTSIVNGSATKSDGHSKLVFHKYGSVYFVAAIWMPNSDHAQEFYTSKNEIQLARNGGQDVVELKLLAKK